MYQLEVGNYLVVEESENVPKIATQGSSGFLGKPITNTYISAGWEVERLSRAASSDIEGLLRYVDILMKLQIEVDI